MFIWQTEPTWFSPFAQQLRTTAMSSTCLAISGYQSETHVPACPCCFQFRGDAINASEGRAVKHFLLRSPLPEGPCADLDLQAVHATLDAMLHYAEAVRADSAITDVVNIGIGGSDLGPQMAVLALDAYATPAKRMHFVSNVDGHELASTLARLRPHSTLFLIASKTFSTIETMTNAASAVLAAVKRLHLNESGHGEFPSSPPEGP